MLDQYAQLARQHVQPEWDDLRETRVLNKVRQSVQQATPRARPSWLGVVALGSVAATLTFFVLSAHVQPTADDPVATTPASDAHSVVSFNEGSRAVLNEGASVTTTEQTSHRIAVSQTSGAVRYEVEPGLERSFEVQAKNVFVRVIGTVFTVDVEDDHVAVRVTRGKVEVNDNGRTIQLTAGDRLRVAVRDTAPRSDEEPKLEAKPRRPVVEVPVKAPPVVDESVEGLMSTADEARREGDLGRASDALRTLLQTYPQDPRATTAWFTLGRVERARGRHTAAAQAFRAAERRAGRGALAEDAIAETAGSWAAAGSPDKAQAAARRYLARYPEGAHAARMRRLTSSSGEIAPK